MATRPIESIPDFRVSGRSAGLLALLAFLLGYGLRGSDDPPAPAHFAANPESGFVATLVWGTLITLGWTFRERIGAVLRDAPRSRLLLVGLAFVPVAIADLFTTQLLATLSANPICTAPAPTLPGSGDFLPRSAILGGTMLLVLLAWERHVLGRAPAPRAEPFLLPPAPPAAPGDWLDFPEAPLLRVRAGDVALIRSAGNYSEIVAHDRAHLVRATLSELAERLEPMGFVRVHRQTVINARNVQHIYRDGAGRALIHLAGGSSVPVGRRYMAAIDALTR